MEQASFRLMKAMLPLGLNPEVLSLHPIGGLGSFLREAGISHEGLNYWGPVGLGIVAPLVAKIKTSPADRIVMTGPHLAAMLALKIAKRRGSFLAVHYHHTGVKSKTAWKLIYRLALDRFQWVTFPSDFVRNEAIAIHAPLRERSMTIRYPQDPSSAVDPEQRDSARARLGLSDSALVVGNAGWLIARKRFDVFLRVAAAVLRVEPRAVFLIAGGGEEEERLRRLAMELGIGDQIRWLGWLRDMSDFQSSLDVLLFNSDWDALGLTPQEAAARGIPLVASIVNGGLREVLDNESSARVLTTHDVVELARQILEIRAQPERARSEALRCREYLLRMTDPAVIAEAHYRLLTSS